MTRSLHYPKSFLNKKWFYKNVCLLICISSMTKSTAQCGQNIARQWGAHMSGLTSGQKRALQDESDYCTVTGSGQTTYNRMHSLSSPTSKRQPSWPWPWDCRIEYMEPVQWQLVSTGCALMEVCPALVFVLLALSPPLLLCIKCTLVTNKIDTASNHTFSTAQCDPVIYSPRWLSVGF